MYLNNRIYYVLLSYIFEYFTILNGIYYYVKYLNVLIYKLIVEIKYIIMIVKIYPQLPHIV